MGKVLTVKDLAKRFRVSNCTIYRLIERHGLPAFRVGSDWRFNAEQIEQWEREQTIQTGGDRECTS